MRILLVIDQYDNENNGTTISAKRFASTLKDHGHDVKIVSMGKNDENKYLVEELHIPLVSHIANKQGMSFAKPEESILKEAISNCDIVHFYMPFPLAIKGLKIAKELGVPHTAAFHVQPENITYNAGLSKANFVAEHIYEFYKKIFYDEFTHIHCPSNFIASELKRHNYKAKLHVISNGVDPSFTYRKTDKNKELDNKICILMIGRLSNEKRQDVLIEAVKKSKYSDNIQLIFAGKGPKYEKYKELGSSLNNKPKFGFYSKEDLVKLISMCDLYVHSADIEIEAISCIEAFSTGLVPIISNSSKSATKQFALDGRSLFEHGNSEDLAKKIDYWIEHEYERSVMEIKYSEYGKKFNIDSCVRKFEEMFMEAIDESKNYKVEKNG